MEIIIISSMWCSACLVMKKVFNTLSDKYLVTLFDYDMDEEEVKKYNVGKIIPVIIIKKNGNEVKRIIGEKSMEEVQNEIKKYE